MSVIALDVGGTFIKMEILKKKGKYRHLKIQQKSFIKLLLS